MSASQSQTFAVFLPCPCTTPYRENRSIVHCAIGPSFKCFPSSDRLNPYDYINALDDRG